MFKYTLKEVLPSIYHFSTENQYDLAMTFLRYQEFYENPEWKGKDFTIFEFMNWYVKDGHRECFTYPDDWAGYNIPSYVIYDLRNRIKDGNIYDDIINEVADQISSNFNATRKDFYLIGTINDDGPTIEHEIAHGLFYTNQDYKNEMLNEVNKLPKKLYENLTKSLHEEMMYHKDVLDDEIQAYMATGLVPELNKNIRGSKRAEIRKPFKDIFKKYKKLSHSQRTEG